MSPSITQSYHMGYQSLGQPRGSAPQGVCASTLPAESTLQEMLSEDIFHLKAWLTLPEAEDRAASSSKSSQLFPQLLCFLSLP